MTTVIVSMSDELTRQLNETAGRLGVSPQELAQAGLEDWLRRPREDFAAAAQYVLRKNEELYRRLA